MIQVIRRSIVDIYSRYSFSRQSLAYDSKGKLYHLHNARYETGKFGQAVMVEEGTTNKLANGDCEIAVPTLGGVAGSHAGIATPTLDTAQKFGGASSLKITTDATAGRVDRYFGLGSQASLNGLTAGAVYAFSVYVYIPSASGINPSKVYLRAFDHNTVGYQETNSQAATATDTWQRLTVIRTMRSDADAIFFRIEIYQDITNASIYVDNLQVEQKAYATSFHPSTRSPETLTIPTAGVLSAGGPWTIEWLGRTNVSGVTYRVPIALVKGTGANAANRYIDVALDGSNRPYISYWNGSTVVAKTGSTLSEPTTMHYWALTYDGTTVKLFVDGVAVIITAATLAGNFPDELFVGFWDGNTYYWNGLIDDLRISSRARTDAEIADAYASNAPLPVDADTTLKLDFDGPDAQRAAKVLVA
ncbi:MAG: hypothetical protein H5U02_00240 [Clostridia bacterium]|nr:hypothetical protein [Clostridia bacterium]